MGMHDDKVLTWNVSWKQAAGLAAVFALCFAVIYFEALVIGFTVVTIALSVFFVMVGFDIGLPKGVAAETIDAPGASAASAEEGRSVPAREPRRNPARNVGRGARSA